jgi:hypothetical protein
MVMMIMLMGRDCVSDLRPLFIPKVICEHEEAQWNDIDRKTPDSSTRALSGNPMSTAI